MVGEADEGGNGGVQLAYTLLVVYTLLGLVIVACAVSDSCRGVDCE